MESQKSTSHNTDKNNPIESNPPDPESKELEQTEPNDPDKTELAECNPETAAETEEVQYESFHDMLYRKIDLMLDGKYTEKIIPADYYFVYDTQWMHVGPYLPVTIHYFVGGVAFEEATGKVLMTQEAFPPCRGQWYIPYGEVEELESIEEALVRVVKEETGLNCVPKTLIAIESPSPYAIKFIFAIEIIDGHLRWLNHQDSHTLQGRWQQVDTVDKALLRFTKLFDELKEHGEFVIRGRDIISHIHNAHDYLKTEQEFKFQKILPILIPCHRFLVRVLAMTTKHVQRDRGLYVLWRRANDNPMHFPVIDYSPSAGNPVQAIDSFFKFIHKEALPFDVCGVLQVEHTGKDTYFQKYDGLCLSLLVAVTSEDFGFMKNVKKFFIWKKVRRRDAVFKLLGREHKNMTLPFIPPFEPKYSKPLLPKDKTVNCYRERRTFSPEQCRCPDRKCPNIDKNTSPTRKVICLNYICEQECK